MKKTLRNLALAAMMTAGAFSAQLAEAADKLKIGFVYVGPIGDHGWSYQHDQGRLAIEKAFGDKVETTYVEKVSEGPDAERVIRQLAASGHKLIFTTSFGFMDPTINVAKQFPNVKFEHATGFKTAKNVSNYSARFYEGRYIIGKIAGHLTKTNKVGYIASMPIPEVIRGVNAFTLGLRSVKPEAKVLVNWANTWYDPAKEADVAKALIAQGADIITQHTDSPAPLQAAQNAGIKGFGQASDMKAFAKDAQLTSIVDNWNDYYVARTKAVLDGTWASQSVWQGLKEGMVQMTVYENMPANVQAIAKQTEADIASGKFVIFKGPLKNRDGTIMAKEGESLDDKALAGMKWFVEGVVGDLPK